MAVSPDPVFDLAANPVIAAGPPAERLADQQIVERYCAAWIAGDTLAVVSLYHPDLELQWPGVHRLAGTHHGRDDSINALLALQAVTNRTPVDLVDVLIGSHSVMAVVDERWTDPTPGETNTIVMRRHLDFTVLEGQLRTCRIYESDQAVVDDWIERVSMSLGEV